MSGGVLIGLAADAVVAVLLVATIAYAVVLNRKLAALRGTKAELETVASRLIESTEKAEGGIESLKDHALDSGETLQQKVDSAQGLVDDLQFLIEKGNGLAGRLDDLVGAARANAGPGAAFSGRGVNADPEVIVAPPAHKAGGATAGSGQAGQSAQKGGEHPFAEESTLRRALQSMR